MKKKKKKVVDFGDLKNVVQLKHWSKITILVPEKWNWDRTDLVTNKLATRLKLTSVYAPNDILSV